MSSLLGTDPPCARGLTGCRKAHASLCRPSFCEILRWTNLRSARLGSHFSTGTPVQLYLSVAFIAIVRKRGLERTSRPFNIPHTSQSHFNTHKHTHALSRPPCCFMTLRAQLFLSPPATGARGRLHTVFARRTLNVMRAHVMSLRTTHEAVSQLQIVDSVLRK